MIPQCLGQFDTNYIIFKMLKFSKIISSKSKNIMKENNGYLRIFQFVEMNVSKLINYLTDICWNGQGTTALIKYIYLGLNSYSYISSFSNTGNWRFFTIQHPWKVFHTTQALLTRTGCSLYNHKVLQGFVSLCIWKHIPPSLKMLAFTN
jgi:hypothetical protein